MANKIMRNVFLGALLTIVIIMGGCQSGQDGKRAKAGSDSAAAAAGGTHIIDTATTVRHSSLTVTKTNGDSLIIAAVTAGSIPDSIALQVDHAFQRIHVEIKNVTTDSLVATLSMPAGGRNLRFNQIVMPGGAMDGPFGNDIHYGTPKQGNYTLIIGKDNMADGQVEGPVTVYLKLF